MKEQVAKIKQARALLAAAMAGCELPQIEAMLRNADMELHWALWNLGVNVSLRPELDHVAATGRARARPRKAKRGRASTAR